MKTAFTVLAAVVVVPFVAGFFAAIALLASSPVLGRWAALRIARAEAQAAGFAPGRYTWPIPPPPGGLRNLRTRVRGRAIANREMN